MNYPENNPVAESLEFTRQSCDAIRAELAKVIVGQADTIDQILISIFTRNHALLMGVPGLAKTLLISTLSRALALDFRRIQFTPDLMPSDITGTEVLSQDPHTGAKEFRFMAGPLFSNIVLADEINRTPPKTQAAMLEAMQERRVTVGGTTHALPDPFFVLATQNPLEQEGTYPLPEAQLDRFLFLIRLDYPSADEELEVMRRAAHGSGEQPEAVLDESHIAHIQQLVRALPVSDHVLTYARSLVRATRPHTEESHPAADKYLSFGAGPRASLGLMLAAKGHAVLNGQPYAGAHNVAAVALPVLRHRIAVNFAAQGEKVTSDDVVRTILEATPQA